MITIDFEIRNKLSLPAVGVHKYAAHPSVFPLCMAYKIGSNDTELWRPGDPFPFDRDFDDLIEAHNAGFERQIWTCCMVPYFEWPEVPLERWRCSMAKVAHYALPRALEKVAKVLGTVHQKDMKGHAIMMSLATPKKQPRKDLYLFRNNKPENFKLNNEYCIGDVDTEYEVSSMFPSLSAFEQKLWELDQRMNDSGIQLDTGVIESALSLIAEFTDELNGELQDITDEEIQTSGQVKKIIKWLDENEDLRIPNLQVATVSEFLDLDFVKPRARRVLGIRKALSKTSTKKLQSMINRICDDGRVRDYIEYYAADRTGRYAGRGIQIQNFPKKNPENLDLILQALENRDLKALKTLGSPLDLISSIVRSVLIPAPDRIFRCGDFSQIEVRVLAWLTKCARLLALFESGEDPYVDMAKEVYGGTEINSTQRDVGKTAVLGCGYQMGKVKFQATIKSQTGLELHLDQCDLVVKTYRTTFPEIKDFWDNINTAAIRAVRSGKVTNVGSIKLKQIKDVLRIKLPSGRCLSYQQPRVEYSFPPWGGSEKLPRVTYAEVDSQTKQWVRSDTYGGKLTENIIQAIARDFMAYAMLRVSGYGYELLFTVHDELLAECVEDFGSLEHFLGLMEGPLPQWGRDCPIKVDGWEGYRYRK